MQTHLASSFLVNSEHDYNQKKVPIQLTISEISENIFRLISELCWSSGWDGNDKCKS